jgi:hypothetical protein
VAFGDGEWHKSVTTWSGPSLVAAAVNHDVGLPAFQTAGSYHWVDDNTLELVLRYIEGPHSETFVCHFDGNNIKIEAKNSFEYGKKTTVITGAVQ